MVKRCCSVQRVVVGKTSRCDRACQCYISLVGGSSLQASTVLAANAFLEWIVQVAIPGEPFGYPHRSAGGARRAVEREKVAVEGPLSLGAIGEVGEGGAESLRVSLRQSQTCCREEQGVDATAQCATSGLDYFSHKSRTLTKKIYDKIAR
jgi:hypothetical protein